MSTLILDTETTGRVDPVRLIEAAWISVSGPPSLLVNSTFEQRYNPGKPIEIGAMAIHHILDADLADCPPADTFRMPDGVDFLVGHNIDYDWGVIGKPNVKRICTLAMSRKIWPDADSHTQSSLMYLLAKDRNKVRDALKSAHSALADQNARQTPPFITGKDSATLCCTQYSHIR